MEKQSLNISCSTVTLDVFIDCDINGNLKRLSDSLTDNELLEAWQRLCNEYTTLIGGSVNDYKFIITKQVYVLKSRIEAALLCLKLPEKTSKEQLERLGYKGTTGKIIALIKRDKIMLSEKIKELNKLSDNGEKQTATNYGRWIAQVGKFMAFKIDKKTTTVSEFIDYHNLMKEEYARKVSK